MVARLATSSRRRPGVRRRRPAGRPTSTGCRLCRLIRKNSASCPRFMPPGSQPPNGPSRDRRSQPQRTLPGSADPAQPGRMNTKIALVTGANKGIGKEIARQLGQAGFTVLVASRDRVRGELAVKELVAEGSDAAGIQLEVTDEASVRSAAAQVESRYGRLDVLVNNAAILPADDDAVSRIAAGVLRSAFETNVLGLVGVTQAFLPLLRRAEEARIVNLSTSLASFELVGDPESRMSTRLTLG